MAIVIQFPQHQRGARTAPLATIATRAQRAESTLDADALARMEALSKSCEEVAKDIREASGNIQRLLAKTF